MAMEKTESKGTFFVRRCAGSRLLVSGAALFAGYRKNDALAARLYPGYTPSQLVLLAGAQTPQEAQARADAILRRNESVALVWDAKALVSATQAILKRWCNINGRRSIARPTC